MACSKPQELEELQEPREPRELRELCQPTESYSLDVYLVTYVSFIGFSVTSVVRFLHRGQAQT